MSDSDCSNCSEIKCPYRYTTYDCYNNKIISAKNLSSEVMKKIKEMHQFVDSLIDKEECDYLSSEFGNLNFHLNEFIELRKSKIFKTGENNEN